MSASGKLAVAKLSARCIVADGPQAAALADRATKALRHEFPDAARRAFACWLDRSDESVWVVRRVDLSVLTAADAPTDALAGSVVTALGRALGVALSGEGDGVNVIRFENRASYLARFVTDASSGDAWSRWYHAPLSGLKMLPASCAIRTAITQDPAVGRQALERLDPSALGRVAAAITSQDEVLILDSLVAAAAEGAANEDADFDAAWTECLRQLQRSRAPPSPLIAAIRGDATAKRRGFLRALRRVRSVVEQVQALSATRRAQLESAIAAGNHDTAVLDALGSATPVPARALREILVHTAGTRRGPSQDMSAANTATQFGGLFLLMQDVQELPREALHDRTVVRTLQWLTLASCAGRERVEPVLYDAVFREIFGISQSATLREIALGLRDVGARRCAEAMRALHSEEPALPGLRGQKEWLAFDRRLGLSCEWSRLIALAARRALRTFARRLPGFAEASPRYLWDNFLCADASLEHEEGRVVVRYGRPPLHLILTLTGMTRGLTTGHDPHGRPVVVFAKE